jgi:predicted acyl esterase
MSLSPRILGPIFKLPRAQSHSIEVQHRVVVPMADGVLLRPDRYFAAQSQRDPTVLPG